MDAAIIFSAIGIIAGSIISYFLIDDAVVTRVPERVPAIEEVEPLAAD